MTYFMDKYNSTGFRSHRTIAAGVYMSCGLYIVSNSYFLPG